jgi:hypothetical protein
MANSRLSKRPSHVISAKSLEKEQTIRIIEITIINFTKFFEGYRQVNLI